MERRAGQNAITQKRPSQHIIHLLGGNQSNEATHCFALSMSCLLAAPLLAQTTVGGGTCTSASLTGIYAVFITARQVTASGTFTGVFQANGAANFDGLSQ